MTSTTPAGEGGGHGWCPDSCTPPATRPVHQPTLADYTAYCERKALEHDRAADAITRGPRGEDERWEERRFHKRRAKAYRLILDHIGDFLS